MVLVIHTHYNLHFTCMCDEVSCLENNEVQVFGIKLEINVTKTCYMMYFNQE